MVSVQPDISDTKFDHLVKVVTAIFSIVKAFFSILFESVAVLRLAKYWYIGCNPQYQTQVFVMPKLTLFLLQVPPLWCVNKWR